MANKADGTPKKPSSKPDIATLGGLLLAAGGILGGLIWEGGKLTDIAQLTALMIVLGGTLGAVMVTTPLRTLIKAAKCLGGVFFERSESARDVIEEIISYAIKARKNSIISLESDLERISDPFLRKAISLSVDGTDLQELRKMMELDIEPGHKHGEAIAKVYEAAGGYAPNHRHYRRGAGADPGDEASGEYRRSWPGNRRGFRGDRVRCGVREPVLPAGRKQDQSAIPSCASHQGADAGGRVQYRGRPESRN